MTSSQPHDSDLVAFDALLGAFSTQRNERSPQSATASLQRIEEGAIPPRHLSQAKSHRQGSASGQKRTVPAKSGQTFDKQMYFIFGLIFVTAFVIFAALRIGWDYYSAPLAQRPKHILHESFRPSGLVGQGFGVLGGLLCLLTLLYPLRKRWRVLENLGTPRNWFRFHIYCGIAGPLFATLHTTFKFSGLASICYWSMMLVMVSGFIGRFLFAQIPRNQRGLRLSLQEINEEIAMIRHTLATAGLRSDEIDFRMQTRTEETTEKSALLTGWLDLIRLSIARRRYLRDWNHWLRKHGFTPASTRQILTLLSRKLFLDTSLLTLELTARAFSHWHSLHLPFTYLMFITLMIHVGLAIFLGYTWIF